jgi:hypothetical protein
VVQREPPTPKRAPWRSKSEFLSVGRFGPGRGSVFWYSRYSTGSLRGEATYNLRVGASAGTQSTPVRSIISCSYRFGLVFVSVRSLLHQSPI